MKFKIEVNLVIEASYELEAESSIDAYKKAKAIKLSIFEGDLVMSGKGCLSTINYKLKRGDPITEVKRTTPIE